ncbi:MAG: hypothetical protein ACTS27_02850 [Phycisphaerales bacterium]
MTTRKLLHAFASSALLSVGFMSALAATGCEEGPAEEAGEAIDDAADDAGDAIDDAVD